MGRQPPSEYVDREEAARLLGVCTKTLAAWTKQGLISPRFLDDRKKLQYRRSDIQMLRLAREDKSINIWPVRAVALQALATARAMESRVTSLLEQLGLDVPPLARDERSIQALYETALTPSTSAQRRDPAWWRFWGASFFGMDEVYFELVSRTCYDDEPWKCFMDFASDVLREVDEDGSEELAAAQRYFRAGTRHLWYVGYMFCRRVRGRRVADAVFSGSRSAVDELMAILH